MVSPVRRAEVELPIGVDEAEFGVRWKVDRHRDFRLGSEKASYTKLD